MPIQAYAALAPGAPLEPFSYEPGPLGESAVEVAVTHCGLCHSDASMLRNEWGISRYPFVPGHEAIGIVEKVGSAVRGVKPGMRVGVGWQAHSCGVCPDCRQGDENFCAVDNKGTIVDGYGGFAEALRVDHRFAIPIPDGYDSAEAGPMMCGGITVFTPLMDYGVRAAMRVGVIGIGGLGHLALQFARAMGCEVTAFSGSPSKEAEALRFGAHHFISTRAEGAFEGLARRFDFILNTVSGDIDWGQYIQLLKPRGQLVTVGVPENDIRIPAFPLILAQARVGGSPIGSPAAIQRMLDFAQTFAVAPAVEHMAMTDINAAIARLDQNQARYRIVLRR